MPTTGVNLVFIKPGDQPESCAIREAKKIAGSLILSKMANWIKPGLPATVVR